MVVVVVVVSSSVAATTTAATTAAATATVAAATPIAPAATPAAVIEISPLLLIMFITIIIHMNYNNTTELFQNNKVIINENRPSTIHNPLMNLSVSDYNSNKNIIIDKNVTNETINKNLVHDLPYNEDGGSNQKMFERSFYTMPVTNLYNDQTEFAKWLYDTGPTCKENTILCSNTITDRISMGNNS